MASKLDLVQQFETLRLYTARRQGAAGSLVNFIETTRSAKNYWDQYVAQEDDPDELAANDAQRKADTDKLVDANVAGLGEAILILAEGSNYTAGEIAQKIRDSLTQG